MKRLWLALFLLPLFGPVHAEKTDQVRLECQAALEGSLQEMLRSLDAISGTKKLTENEYERLVASVKATHEGNVNLCVVGRRYFLELPR